MRTIQPGDWVEYSGTLWQVIADDVTLPGRLVIRRATDGHLETRPRTELLPSQSQVNGLLYRTETLADLSQLQQASADERERAQLIAKTIAQVGTEGAHRAEQVQTALSDCGHHVSLRQIQRYLRAFDEHGSVGLLDRRKDNRPARFHDAPAGKALLEELMHAERDSSTGTRSRLLQRARWEAEKRGVALPSDRTVYRWMRELEAGRATFGQATTRRSKALRPDRTYRRHAVTRPGELVEIDSTPLDVLTALPDGSTVRPELTYAIDVATNTICGTLLLPRATKSVDIAATLLARMLIPIVRRPGWEAQLDSASAIFGQDAFPPRGHWHELASAKPVIVPETVMIDRGKVFTGQTFREACERLEISQIVAAPRQPTDKPHVEGGFKRIREGLIQYLAGYTGNSVVLRGLNPEKDAVWTVEELQLIIDLWVLSVWQIQPQSGLRLAHLPGATFSPNQMYEVLSGLSPQRSVSLESRDYLALMPFTWRSVQHYGINFEGLIYDAPQLHPLRGRKSPDGGAARGRWEVRYDPFNMCSIWVRGPGDHWIEARWTLADHVSRPFSLDVLRAAVRVAKRTTEGAASPAGDTLLRQIERVQAGRIDDKRGRQAARTAQTASPLLPRQTPEPPPAPSAPPPLDLRSLPRLRQLD